VSELEFDVVRHEHGTTVRSRKIFDGCAVFQGSDNSAVLVSPEIVGDMLESARQAGFTEVGGLLVGRQFRDAYGAYVVTLGSVSAPVGEGQPGSLTLTAEQTAKLREAAALTYPSMDVVGWWHSHSAPSEYSAVDLSTQRMWTQPTHVGLLVFATGKVWGRVYLGPHAQELPLTVNFPGPAVGGDAARSAQKAAKPARTGRRWFFRVRRWVRNGQRLPEQAALPAVPEEAAQPAQGQAEKTRTVRRDGQGAAGVISFLVVLVALLSITVLLLSVAVSRLIGF
jgi:proteasome lid subunit RPN8/RPN11